MPKITTTTPQEIKEIAKLWVAEPYVSAETLVSPHCASTLRKYYPWPRPSSFTFRQGQIAAAIYQNPQMGGAEIARLTGCGHHTSSTVRAMLEVHNLKLKLTMQARHEKPAKSVSSPVQPLAQLVPEKACAKEPTSSSDETAEDHPWTRAPIPEQLNTIGILMRGVCERLAAAHQYKAAQCVQAAGLDLQAVATQLLEMESEEPVIWGTPTDAN